MNGFKPGQRVRVRAEWPERHGPVHIRTPHYVRGREGEIAAFLGVFPNPEDLAFDRPAPPLPLYHVRFRPEALWPAPVSGTEILVEIFAPWLIPL
jgi:hypothetical protein